MRNEELGIRNEKPQGPTCVSACCSMRERPLLRRRGGNLPPGGNGVCMLPLIRDEGPPLQGHSSHSPLWASHQAGKAGSFGERVGVTALQSGVSWYLAINLLIILISFAADK